MRPVSDILFGLLNPQTGELMQGPVAYDLHRDHHEGICPWCAEDLGAVVMPAGSDYMELYSRLYNKQMLHMLTCPKREATEMCVEVKK